jgi:hypothetical protein
MLLMWGDGALAALLDPTRGVSGHLVLGLAVAVTALLVAAAVALPVLLALTAPGLRPPARHARAVPVPRLLDPDAAGRPRPRAPSLHPATA